MRSITASLVALFLVACAADPPASPAPIDYGDAVAHVAESEGVVEVRLHHKWNDRVLLEVEFDRVAGAASWRLADGSGGSHSFPDDATAHRRTFADASYALWSQLQAKSVAAVVDEPSDCLGACGLRCSQCDVTTTVSTWEDGDTCFEREKSVYDCQCADCCLDHDLCRRSCQWWNLPCQLACDVIYATCLGGLYPEAGIPVPGGFRDCGYTAHGPVVEVDCPNES